MKILMVSHYYHPHGGGVERHLARLNQELLAAGHQITVLTLQHDCNLATSEELDGVQVRRLPVPDVKFLGLLWIWVWTLGYWQFFRRFDLVHIHDVFNWLLPIRLLLPFKKIFITFHGYISSPISIKEKLWHQLAVRLTTGSICIGDFIPQHFGSQPDRVIYGAVDVDHFSQARLPKNIKKYDAVFAGRFNPQIGVDIYLKGIELLQQESSFEVLFLGDGPGQQKAAQLGDCLGWVDDVAPYLKAAHFAFVSRYLGMLEAMAAGKLIFAACDPKDQVKKDYLQLAPFAEWIIVVNSAQDLATQVRYYQNHRKEARVKLKAAAAWVQDQTWERVAATYQQLWRDKA